MPHNFIIHNNSFEIDPLILDLSNSTIIMIFNKFKNTVNPFKYIVIDTEVSYS